MELTFIAVALLALWAIYAGWRISELEKCVKSQVAINQLQAETNTNLIKTDQVLLKRLGVQP